MRQSVCCRPVMSEQEENGRAFLPFIKGVTDRIGHLIQKHQVGTIFLPMRSIQQHLKIAKDARDPLSSCGVYTIPCLCRQVYIRTKCSVTTRIKEYRCCLLLQSEKSAIAEYILANSSHDMLFKETKILSSSLQF